MPMPLTTFIAQYKTQPFAWGTADCSLIVADWVLQQTGVDPARGLRGTYTSAEGAVRALRKAGYTDLPSAMDDRMGPRLAPLQLRRGDVALVATADGPALTLHCGQCLFGMGPAGVVPLPISAAVCGWRCVCQP